MKATGIVRHIDDLGRVVIPKELRKKFNIREGEALEIFTTDEGIVFAPYDNQTEKETFATNWLRKYKDALKNNRTKFSVDGGVTTCEVINGDRNRKTGVSTCDSRDDFSPAIGMVISYCRAIGCPIPTELQ